MRFQKLFFTILFVCFCLFTISCGEGIVSFMHANVNCSDLEQSIEFYEMLGFTKVMGAESTVSAEFAEGLGFDEGYTLDYAQLIHKDASLIDLIRWREPYDSSAPYENVNHLGIARITLESANLDEDISILSSNGVEFFSEPATRGSERFVCFKDPDGTIIELVQRGESSSADDSDINITGFLSVTINCSNIEESRNFYKEKLSFESVMDFKETGSQEAAEALGLGVDAYEVVGSLMTLNKGPAVELLKWIEPYNGEAPYAQLNHLGIPRIALRTMDLDAEIFRLEAEGVAFFSEPKQPDGLISFLKFACFTDPNGTAIELVELFPGPF